MASSSVKRSSTASPFSFRSVSNLLNDVRVVIGFTALTVGSVAGTGITTFTCVRNELNAVRCEQQRSYFLDTVQTAPKSFGQLYEAEVRIEEQRYYDREENRERVTRSEYLYLETSQGTFRSELEGEPGVLKQRFDAFLNSSDPVLVIIEDQRFSPARWLLFLVCSGIGIHWMRRIYSKVRQSA